MQVVCSRFLSSVTFLLTFSLITFAAERPVVVGVTIPAYPAIAVAKRISGTVLVDVQVNAEGKVTEANPIMGHELLREAARKAALRWRFKPLDNSPNLRSVRLTFIFHDISYVAPVKEPEFTSPYQVEIEWNPTTDEFNGRVNN